MPSTIYGTRHPSTSNSAHSVDRASVDSGREHFNEKFIGIDFARKELAGNTYIVGVREALVGATLTASGEASSAAAGAAAARRLQQVEADYGAGMQSADLNAGLSAKLDKLASTPAADRSTEVAGVLATGRDLLTRIGNQSNLILDLDSYYTMSLIVLRYPELLEIVDNIGRLVATLAASPLEVSEARTRYLILEGKLDATMQGIQSDYSEAVAASSKGLDTTLNPTRQRLEASVERFRQEARTADAQRALVEATPIPIIVTAIPSHEVLHANPPAEVWLGGSRFNPWKDGLESLVRARFFQQLADRGAVDEFEVRWCGGAEPAWAVLSARRVSYHGMDAMLTTFTPINHLKLLERRLELWAKVFEASSEGILIVDAQQHILTANRAFSDHTG